MRIHIASTACDVISFNGQGQLCPLSCVEWKTSFKPYQNRHNSVKDTGQEKKAKNHVTLTWKLPWKSCSTTHWPFPSWSTVVILKILKAFLKTFPTKMKSTKCPAKEEKWGKKSKKRGKKRKRKVKVKTLVSLLSPKLISKICLLCMPEVHKLIVWIWIRRPQSVRPVHVNGFMVSFSSL